MNRLKKLAGINEHHGAEVAKGGEFSVELNGDSLYFYDGENTIRVNIPVNDMVDIIKSLVQKVPEIGTAINATTSNDDTAKLKKEIENLKYQLFVEKNRGKGA